MRAEIAIDPKVPEVERMGNIAEFIGAAIQQTIDMGYDVRITTDWAGHPNGFSLIKREPSTKPQDDSTALVATYYFKE